MAPASAEIAVAIPLELVIRVLEMSREVGGIEKMRTLVKVVGEGEARYSY